MGQRADVERYRENWQDEVDSAAEYGAMAESERDPKIAKVYSNLARMEEAHIAFWEDRLRSAGERIESAGRRGAAALSPGSPAGGAPMRSSRQSQRRRQWIVTYM